MFGALLFETDDDLRKRLIYVCLPYGKINESRLAHEIVVAAEEQLDSIAAEYNLRRRQFAIP